MDERRRSDRVKVEGEFFGKMKSSISVRVIDLSENGALVESPVGLPPHRSCDLSLPTKSGPINVRALILRCRAQAVPTGLKYYAGVEFQDVSDISKEKLRETLDHIVKLNSGEAMDEALSLDYPDTEDVVLIRFDAIA